MHKHPTTPITVPRRYPPAPLVGVGVVVFNTQGQVLLVKRGHPPAVGSVEYTRGSHRCGRTFDGSAHREVREECAIEIELGDLVAVFEPIERDAEQRVEYHYVILDYWARHISGEPFAQDDAAAVVWVAVAGLAPFKLRGDTADVIMKAYQVWQAL